MRVAIIGSRSLSPVVEDYLPPDTTLIVTGGAQGVDAAAECCARRRGIPLLIFTPNYARYGRRAPLVRNEAVVQAADWVLAFWDGRSRGTAYTLRYARQQGVPVEIVTADGQDYLPLR